MGYAETSRGSENLIKFRWKPNRPRENNTAEMKANSLKNPALPNEKNLEMEKTRKGDRRRCDFFAFEFYASRIVR